MSRRNESRPRPRLVWALEFRAWLEKSGLTRQEASEWLGVRVDTVDSWLEGQRQPGETRPCIGSTAPIESIRARMAGLPMSEDLRREREEGRV